jgi:glycosyltransferase involved in cell wall biosynthesis
VRQSFTDWELILVNDCSPDGSQAVAKACAARDPRIRVLSHEVNLGVSHARFTGLKAATGRYVVFVDSDDRIPKQSLRALFNKIESDRADVVIGAMVKVFGRRGLIRSQRSNNAAGRELLTESITAPELMERYFLNFFGVNLIPSYMCGKIYRREALDRAPLEPVAFPMFEDTMFNMVLHPHLTRIGFVPDVVYFYRIGGTTGSSTPRFLPTVKAQFAIKQQTIQQFDYQQAVPYIKMELINCFFSHFVRLALLNKLNLSEIATQVTSELADPIYGPELFRGLHTSTPRSLALQSRNVDSIMELLKAEIRSARPRHILKNILSLLTP